jgi:fatty acid desaturase
MLQIETLGAYQQQCAVNTKVQATLAKMYILLRSQQNPYFAGTVATGMWVVAHECGHRAFSDNTKLQNVVGYIFHTVLMVPYFSWQRSHAVHHARTNHMSEGETHVPYAVSDNTDEFHAIGEAKLAKRKRFFAKGPTGKIQFGLNRLWSHLVFGWPAYIIGGATGGPIRGKTCHFDPTKGTQGKNALFPGKFGEKVYWSDYGIAAMGVGLLAWGTVAGWQAPALLYGLPLMVTNMWLVLYTWLQHTDVDVPHFDKGDWTWSKGTFMTIDRPYGPIFNFLHHGIGSTHVVHHINHEIPHYNAWEATEAVKNAFPDLYLYDPTPIHQALWRVSTHCVAVEKKDGAMGAWVFNAKTE